MYISSREEVNLIVLKANKLLNDGKYEESREHLKMH